MNQLLVGILAIIGAALQVLILHALIKDCSYRKYPFLFANVLVVLVTTIIDTALYNFKSGTWAGTALLVFWINDAIRQVLLFILVLSLVYGAMATGRKRLAVQRLLIFSSLLLAAVSYFSNSDPRISARMSAVIRNMSFSAAILNLGLWAALIRTKQRDSRILMISGGLGLQITGEAMGHSLRNLWQISRAYVTAGNSILILAHLFCLLVWWQAFRSSSSKELPPKAETRSPPFDEDKARGYTGTTSREAFQKSVHPRPAR
jgi:hypothetical protein